MQKDTMIRDFRDIPSKLRLVQDDGDSDIVGKQAAIDALKESGLDLICMVPDADPPVFKLINWNKYQYDQKKKDKKLRQQQRANQRGTKEITFGISIEEHDLKVKLAKIQQLLEDNDVKITVRANRKNRMALPRGMNLQHYARTETDFVLKRVIAALKDEVHPATLVMGDSNVSTVLKKIQE